MGWYGFVYGSGVGQAGDTVEPAMMMKKRKTDEQDDDDDDVEVKEKQQGRNYGFRQKLDPGAGLLVFWSPLA